MTWMVDAAWGIHAVAAAQHPDVEVVSGYLSHDPSKNITRADIEACHRASTSVLLNWEATVTGALKGTQQGTADAQDAVYQARQLGAPAGVAIVYSDDTQSTVDQVRPYYAAASKLTRDAGYLSGAYGPTGVVVTLLREGVIDVAWDTNAGSWNAGTSNTGTHIQQLTTHPIAIPGVDPSQFDVNQILQPIPGLWTSTGPSSPGGFLMALTDAQQKELYDIVTHFKDVLQGNLLANAVPNYFTDMHNGIGFLVAQAAKSHATTGEVDVSALTDAIKALPHEVVVALRNALPAS